MNSRRPAPRRRRFGLFAPDGRPVVSRDAGSLAFGPVGSDPMPVFPSEGRVLAAAFLHSNGVILSLRAL